MIPQIYTPADPQPVSEPKEVTYPEIAWYQVEGGWSGRVYCYWKSDGFCTYNSENQEMSYVIQRRGGGAGYTDVKFHVWHKHNFIGMGINLDHAKTIAAQHAART